MIPSVGSNNYEVIKGIIELHIPSGRFNLDPCFSFGRFYRGLPEPTYKFDIKPQREDVKQADSRAIPLPNASITSIMFDPPFMFGAHGQTKNNIMNKRFTMFDSFSGLCIMYQDSLKEFVRLLIPKGILVFKCQDYTDSKTTMTHCLVWKWAEQFGFYAKDLFILVTNAGRIYNPNLKQKHARKTHSYFWVFEKPNKVIVPQRPRLS